MEIIEQSHKIIKIDNCPLELIEKAGRTCYKSESKINKESSEKFTKMIINKGHESVIEHAIITIKFITNRGVLQEIARHRICSLSVESTRYINYKNRDILFILPVWMDKKYLGKYKETSCIFFKDDIPFTHKVFLQSCLNSKFDYNNLINNGWRPEQAREVLPNSLKTEIIMTANLREWKHIFKLRTSKQAHPQIRKLMKNCLEDVKKQVPIIFDSIGEN